ncbi:MAG: hypothetical protein APF84_08555 [Gracilibacter sp. BRH_c7a]|nr:MAG: hypothetical protein APF84_08555 [Gracilibacter sp. BRH_c7a]
MKQISIGTFFIAMATPYVTIGYLTLDHPNNYFIWSIQFALFNLLLVFTIRKGLIKPNQYFIGLDDIFKISAIGVALWLICFVAMLITPNEARLTFKFASFLQYIILALFAKPNKAKKDRVVNKN